MGSWKSSASLIYQSKSHVILDSAGHEKLVAARSTSTVAGTADMETPDMRFNCEKNM